MREIVRVEYSGFGVAFDTCAWFDATSAADHFGKRVNDWIALPSTQEYIQALDDLSRDDSDFNTRKSGIKKWIQTRKGRTGGTWLSPHLAIRFAQWLDVRFAVWCDIQIRALMEGQHPWYEWKHTRHAASASYKVMAEMLTMARESQGKETVAYHHSNEARMVNWCLTGVFAGLDRDQLSRADLDMLAELETFDTLLLAKGEPYEARKQALASRAQSIREKRLGMLSTVSGTVFQTIPGTLSPQVQG